MEPATRKVVQRSPAHTVRLIHLPHLQERAVEADSSVERDFVHIAALYASVKSIQHQPFKLKLEGRTYTPDYLLEFTDRSKAVIEVKPASKIAEYAQLFESARERLAHHQMVFVVATDAVLRREHMAERALMIRRYAKMGFTLEEQERAIDLVARADQRASICNLLGSGVSRACLYHLIAFRKLLLDDSLSIDDSAHVFLPTAQVGEGNHAIRFAGWLDS
jgi:hypothetical protein